MGRSERGNQERRQRPDLSRKDRRERQVHPDWTGLGNAHGHYKERHPQSRLFDADAREQRRDGGGEDQFQGNSSEASEQPSQRGSGEKARRRRRQISGLEGPLQDRYGRLQRLQGGAAAA